MTRDILRWPDRVGKKRIAAHFVVHGDLTSKARARVVTDGKGITRAFTPASTVAWEFEVGQAWRDSSPTQVFPDKTRLGIRLFIWRKNFIGRDTSNILKLIEDALNNLAYDDDRYIDETAIYRFADADKENPRAEILLYKL
jgi:Holliday junction resolvase RusA-like endonuclease|tara:strand:- start:155 stop:577 length:423 start_codon:yes stop_codon:yes gene_type:complete